MGIFVYIAEEDIDAASRFLADLNNKIEWIVKVDFTGSPRDYISKDLRALPYRKRCIYFRSFEDRIIIVRILHSAQDIGQQEFQNGD